MRYVVAYDVPEDPLRYRVAKLLESYGWRVQESVFECVLGDRDLATLRRRLERLLRDSAGGNVRIYRLCEDCHRSSLGVGPVAMAGEPGPCVIV